GEALRLGPAVDLLIRHGAGRQGDVGQACLLSLLLDGGRRHVGRADDRLARHVRAHLAAALQADDERADTESHQDDAGCDAAPLEPLLHDSSFPPGLSPRAPGLLSVMASPSRRRGVAESGGELNPGGETTEESRRATTLRGDAARPAPAAPVALDRAPSRLAPA